MLKTNEIEPQHYRDAMAHFAGAVHVVATNGKAGRRGVTVIAACSVSDKPPTVLVCLNRENPSNDLFLENGRFALNTLPAGEENIANAFSGLSGLSQDERFALAPWDTISTGAPTLVGALAVFDCDLVESRDIATHRIYIGHVAGLRLGANLRPLVYHDRNYRVL